jgi:hypothetical protein
MRSAMGEALGEVLDVLPRNAEDGPCSRGLRTGMWLRLKAMSPTRRAAEIARVLRGGSPVVREIVVPLNADHLRGPA